MHGAGTRSRATVAAAMATDPILAADPEHDRWMDLALDEARQAADHGDIPIGAVVVRRGPDGSAQIVAARHNERELHDDPTAHAEVLALRDAATALGRWRLDDCLLVVPLEPCPMCAGMLVNARVPRVVWGADDPKAGACRTLYRLGEDPRLNHRFESVPGVLADECGAVLKTFFERLRTKRRG